MLPHYPVRIITKNFRHILPPNWNESLARNNNNICSLKISAVRLLRANFIPSSYGNEGRKYPFIPFYFPRQQSKIKAQPPPCTSNLKIGKPWKDSPHPVVSHERWVNQMISSSLTINIPTYCQPNHALKHNLRNTYLHHFVSKLLSQEISGSIENRVVELVV
jgi:hypothetical protein